MKKTNNNNIVVINDNLAESLNLFNYPKFNSKNSQNFLDCSVQVPKVIVSNSEDITNVINGGDFTAPTFNNVSKNEKMFNMNYMDPEHNTLFEDRLITEISNSYNFDLNKKIETFLNNSAEKVLEIFESQYESVFYAKDDLALLEMISTKHNIPVAKIQWLFDKVKTLRYNKIIFSLVDLDRKVNKATPSLKIKMTDPDAAKVFELVNRLIETDLFEMQNYYNYFNGLFEELCSQIAFVKNKPENQEHLIKMYISYFKLLAMRTFECFDVFKNISLDTVNVDKMCILISCIEKEILSLESLL